MKSAESRRESFSENSSIIIQICSSGGRFRLSSFAVLVYVKRSNFDTL